MFIRKTWVLWFWSDCWATTKSAFDRTVADMAIDHNPMAFYQKMWIMDICAKICVAQPQTNEKTSFYHMIVWSNAIFFRNLVLWFFFFKIFVFEDSFFVQFKRLNTDDTNTNPILSACLPIAIYLNDCLKCYYRRMFHFPISCHGPGVWIQTPHDGTNEWMHEWKEEKNPKGIVVHYEIPNN